MYFSIFPERKRKKYKGDKIKVSKYCKYQSYGAKYGRYGTVNNGTKFFEMGSLRMLERVKDLEQRQVETRIFSQGNLYRILGRWIKTCSQERYASKSSNVKRREMGTNQEELNPISWGKGLCWRKRADQKLDGNEKITWSGKVYTFKEDKALHVGLIEGEREARAEKIQ